MRIARILHDRQVKLAFLLNDTQLLEFGSASKLTGGTPLDTTNLLDCLPGGSLRNQVLNLQHALAGIDEDRLNAVAIPVSKAKLLVPIPTPGKLLLLAGNYSKHIEEGGGKAEERAKTFPYVFMKPPATTLTNPGDPIRIPAVSPNQIDWELELGVVIGRECQGVKEAEALSYVAGYTVVNDISDRAFHPNPGRNKRPKDEFFDWQHGKWHDTFCPMGPCVTPADEIANPQALKLLLRVNGNVEQDASTAEMVFPVAAVIEFVSSFVTLLPGDIISTGTPDGVGKAKGKFLKAGDVVEAEIAGIGILRNPVE